MHEDLRTGGFGAEIAAVVADEAFLDLDAPVARVTMPDIPSPHHPKLMEWALPSPVSIRAEIDGWWGSDVIEVRVPDEQEGTKAVVRAWLKHVGDAVAENDPLVELETDKVTQEVPAPAAGVLAEIVLDTDAEAVPGALLGRIETEFPGEGRGPGGKAFSERQWSADAAWTPAFAGERSRNPPFPLGPPRLPAAWHRPGAYRGHRPRRPVTREDVDRAVAGRGSERRRTRDRAAARNSRRRTSRTTGCASTSPRTWSARSARRRTLPLCSKPISPRSPRTRRRWRRAA